MNFSSSVFIYFFLCAFLIVVLVCNSLELRFKRIRRFRISDIIIIVFSFFFYAWACFDNVFFLIIIIAVVFCCGKLISFFNSHNAKTLKKVKSVPFWLTIALTSVMVFLLYYYKYDKGLLFNLDPARIIIAPLGISFLSFSVVSYVVDVYKGEKSGNIIDVALYISFFPKVISGPIIIWSEFYRIQKERQFCVHNISKGLGRVVYGLAKKVIIADYFGSVIGTIQSNSGDNIDIPTSWLISFLYMLQIYYDFSGYSDVSIGLSNAVGFDIPENFNFPYVSTSITEFWRRWHISLGLWFRKYIYIPLGGNRKGKPRTLLNSFIVMFISGIWHGAGLGYMLWGIAHGVCIVTEKIVQDLSGINIYRALLNGLSRCSL